MILTTTDKPTLQHLADLRAAAVAQRPWHVSHPTLDRILAAMRAGGREELLHYAGACYRDDVAYELCLAWLLAPHLPESELKVIALAAVGCGGLTGEDIRAANPGMR